MGERSLNTLEGISEKCSVKEKIRLNKLQLKEEENREKWANEEYIRIKWNSVEFNRTQ